MKRFIKMFAALCMAASGLAAQAQTSTGYGQYQVQSSVSKATVIGVREVVLKTNNQNSNMSYAGQALGGLLGAIVTKGSDNYAMSSAGTIVGSMLGQKIATDWGSEAKAQEIIIKTDSGAVTAITQSSADGVIFFAGQRVIIIGQGRVAPSPDGL